jgi:hypothetical protein
MRRPDFDRFRASLLRSGVAPRNVRRAVLELGDHYVDLVDEAIASGLDRSDAEQRARVELGELDVIAADIAARPELRSWERHHPKLAVAVYPLACVAVLPVAPLIAGIANAPVLVRWAGCAVLGGLVTAAMLLVLQLVITLT